MTSKKIRQGLYTYKNHTIELLNKDAEVYPGDDYYNLWRVTGPDTHEGITANWYVHFLTKKEAMSAIDIEGANHECQRS